MENASNITTVLFKLRQSMKENKVTYQMIADDRKCSKGKVFNALNKEEYYNQDIVNACIDAVAHNKREKEKKIVKSNSVLDSLMGKAAL